MGQDGWEVRAGDGSWHPMAVEYFEEAQLLEPYDDMRNINGGLEFRQGDGPWTPLTDILGIPSTPSDTPPSQAIVREPTAQQEVGDFPRPTWVPDWVTEWPPTTTDQYGEVSINWGAIQSLFEMYGQQPEEFPTETYTDSVGNVWARIGGQIEKIEAAPNRPQNIENLIVNAILDDEWDAARDLFAFANQPTTMQRFDRALALASSPADYATVLGMLRGELPIQQPDARGRIAPYAPWLEEAALEFFNPRTLAKISGEIPMDAPDETVDETVSLARPKAIQRFERDADLARQRFLADLQGLRQGAPELQPGESPEGVPFSGDIVTRDIPISATSRMFEPPAAYPETRGASPFQIAGPGAPVIRPSVPSVGAGPFDRVPPGAYLETRDEPTAAPAPLSPFERAPSPRMQSWPVVPAPSYEGIMGPDWTGDPRLVDFGSHGSHNSHNSHGFYDDRMAETPMTGFLQPEPGDRKTGNILPAASNLTSAAGRPSAFNYTGERLSHGSHNSHNSHNSNGALDGTNKQGRQTVFRPGRELYQEDVRAGKPLGERRVPRKPPTPEHEFTKREPRKISRVSDRFSPAVRSAARGGPAEPTISVFRRAKKLVPFPSGRAWQRMLPSERQQYQRMIEEKGFPWQDYQHLLEQNVLRPFARSFAPGRTTIRRT
jgi:hypothetical protein